MPRACRAACHHALNDVLARTFSSANIPVAKEPAGLFRTDGNSRCHDSNPMEARQASRLVCDSGLQLHLRWFLCGGFGSRGRRCSGVASGTENGKVLWLVGPVQFLSGSSRHKIRLTRWLTNWLAMLADVSQGYLAIIVRVFFVPAYSCAGATL